MQRCVVTFLLRKMNRKIITVLSLVGILATVAGGQVISKPESRSDLLGGMQDTLENVDRPQGSFDSVNSPFKAKIPVAPKPVIKNLDDAPKTVVGKVLPDDQALAIISQQFNPLGSLVLGNRGILQLPENRTIEKGSSFKAEIKGNIYEVTIVDVTSRGYTLGLGTAQISKNFLTTSGTAE